MKRDGTSSSSLSSPSGDEEDLECTFSAHLLYNKDVFDVLDNLQLNELKLLEQMEGYLTKKTILDQEYAEKVARLHQKFPDSALGLLGEGSHLNEAWKAFMKDSVQKATALQACAKSIEVSTLSSIRALIARKRGTHNALAKRTQEMKREFSDFDDEVKRLEATYRENLKEVQKARKKMDEAYNNKKGNHVKLKEQLDNSSRKLHMNHNEYVLAMLALNEYEKLYKTKIMTAYLKLVQDVQEKYVQPWKDIYSGLFTQSACCTEENQAAEKCFSEAVEAIEANSEYTSFVGRNGRPPAGSIPYTFLPALLEDSKQSGLQAEVLAHNDLTHDHIGYKEKSYAKEDGELAQKLDEKTLEYEKESASLKDMTERGTNSAQLSMIEQYVRCMELKGEMRNLECKRMVRQKQMEMLLASLKSIERHGSIPSYATRPTLATANNNHTNNVEQDFNRTASFGDIKKPTVSFPAKLRGARSPPPVPEGKPGNDNRNTMTLPQQDQVLPPQPNQLFEARNKLGSVKINKPLPSVPAKPAKPAAPSLKSSVPATQSVGTDNIPCATYPGQYPESTATSQVPPLEFWSWYHGDIDRNVAADLLLHDGQFLVRRKKDGTASVLSVQWKGVRHFVLNPDSDTGLYKLESEAFPDIPSLINYHYLNAVVVTMATGAILQSPVTMVKEFSHADIHLRVKLGGGNFGDVYQGELLYNKQPIAVKTCKETADERMKKIFLNEAGIMRPCSHPNVLRLIGISRDVEPFYIVLELCPKGDLSKLLLREGVCLSNADLFRFAYDAASGMAYLENMQIIHRDLAARNCLVTQEYVVKVSDFGMSREEDQEGVYQINETRIIPIRWSAPEIWTRKIYSSKSDVWAYGVLLWEIFSRGSVPYSGWDNGTTIKQVGNGYRLPPPNGMPPPVAKLMDDCWQADPRNRPNFQDILKDLTQLESSLT